MTSDDSMVPTDVLIRSRDRDIAEAAKCTNDVERLGWLREACASTMTLLRREADKSRQSSQGVDASLVAQQNQEFMADSGSPTSRRGSHITSRSGDA
jgi:hypothetical protein